MLPSSSTPLVFLFENALCTVQLTRSAHMCNKPLSATVLGRYLRAHQIFMPPSQLTAILQMILRTNTVIGQVASIKKALLNMLI